MNSQSLPCFSGINSLKNGKSGKIWHDKVGYIPLAGQILRNCPASLEFTKKMEKSEQRWHSGTSGNIHL